MAPLVLAPFFNLMYSSLMKVHCMVVSVYVCVAPHQIGSITVGGYAPIELCQAKSLHIYILLYLTVFVRLGKCTPESQRVNCVCASAVMAQPSKHSAITLLAPKKKGVHGAQTVVPDPTGFTVPAFKCVCALQWTAPFLVHVFCLATC